jgi:hypothetical protein
MAPKPVWKVMEKKKSPVSARNLRFRLIIGLLLYFYTET